MAIGYTRVNWQAYPATTTKVSATNLNVMDQGIKDCADAIDALDATKIATASAMTGSTSGSVVTTISQGTTAESALGTLLDNDARLKSDLTDKQPKSTLLSAFQLAKNENYTTDASGNIVFPSSINTNMVIAIRVRGGNYIANIGYNYQVGYYAQITDYQGTPVPNTNVTIDVLFLYGVFAS